MAARRKKTARRGKPAELIISKARTKAAVKKCNVSSEFYGALRGIAVPADVRASAEPPDALIAALEDDINTPKAMAELFAVVRELNKAETDSDKQRLAAIVYASGDLLGLLQTDPEHWFARDVEGELSAEQIEALLEQRRSAKEQKDFDTADAIRNQLTEAGISIQDGPKGTTWRRS